MANISLNNYRLPNKEDMSGAVTALRRLQDTYQVKSSDLANGVLGKEESLDMSGQLQFSLSLSLSLSHTHTHTHSHTQMLT